MGISTTVPNLGSFIEAGEINLDDNDELFFGTGNDASILYDGTNFILRPDIVGSGILRIEQDGFTLDVPTLTQNETIALEGAASLELWTVLANYVAVSAESSHVFNFTAVDFDDDSMLVLVIDGTAAGILFLLIRINEDATASYDTNGRGIAGAEVIVDLNGQTSGHLIEFGTAGSDTKFVGTVYIMLQKGGVGDAPQIISNFHAGTSNNQLNILYDIVTSSITHVEILTSASTWKIGTRMTLYKVKRA